MMASPKKVMARITPATMVTATKATPTKASSTPTQTKPNSDQVRPVNGSRTTRRTICLTWSPRSSLTTMTISLISVRTRVSGSPAPSVI